MKRKGFTLIELLAVLVVLAILALISIPITIRIINNARENSYKRSIENYGRAVELALGNHLVDYSNTEYNTISLSEDKKAVKSGNNITEIEYTGQTVICDTLKVNENGTIELKGCQVVDSQDNSKELSNFYNYINKKLIKAIPYKVYNIGDTFTLNGDSYHIIADSGSNQDYVVALKDTPLTVEEVTTAGGTANDNKGNGSIAGMAYHTSSNIYATSNVKSVVEAWAASKFTDELKIVDGYSARLITRDEHLANCDEVEHFTPSGSYVSYNAKYSWMYNNNYWYWTMTPYEASSSNVRIVHSDGGVYNTNVGFYVAVRPVINVYKDKLPS